MPFQRIHAPKRITKDCLRVDLCQIDAELEVISQRPAQDTPVNGSFRVDSRTRSGLKHPSEVEHQREECEAEEDGEDVDVAHALIIHPRWAKNPPSDARSAQRLLRVLPTARELLATTEPTD
jgi:hypothetical protein